VRTAVDIVVSHCKFRLKWLRKTAAELHSCGFAVESVTVYSKCGRSDAGAPLGASVMRLPNVGRCDHTYATYLSDRDPSQLAPIVLFLKDSILAGSAVEYRALRASVCGMAAIAQRRGFGCGRRPIASAFVGWPSPGQQQCSTASLRSDYHDTALLGETKMPNYVRARPYAALCATHPVRHIALLMILL
jgi:hypothetical protein